MLSALWLTKLYFYDQVIIKIRDLNDNVPTFDIDDYNMTIIEHLPNGFEIMTFRATDRDKVIFNTSCYKMASNEDIINI